ncbi:extracellular solute-binding protein [Marinobacterium aestuariivivens]|uniref:Extracellular solute-binding protein n=1 Tax=Marinobacterium aestuariivivens TaxID=1698799 RepID=A0ABW2A5Y6_9GAMM
MFDSNWRPVFNGPEGVQAGETLKRLMSCSPEGVGSFGFGEMKNSFLQGRAAMFLDSTVVAGEVNNPAKSKVVGKVGWAPHPKGVRRGSQTGGFGLAIPRNGRNPEAAFLLLQWLTSKDVDKMIALAGGNPSRFSTHEDPEINEKMPYMKTFGIALQYADPDWRPIIPVWGEINQLMGTELSKAISGEKSIKDALDGLVEPVTEIMDKAGYYSWNAGR